MQQGNFAKAVDDFDMGLKIAPKEVGIHVNRGFAHLGAGDYSKAAADFQLWATAKPDHPYAALWLHLAQARAGEAPAPLAPAATKDWPAPVMDYFAGKLTRAQLDAEARDAGQRCDVAFYAGEKGLIDARPEDAARDIAQALKICEGPTLERAAALGEDRRLAKRAQLGGK